MDRRTDRQMDRQHESYMSPGGGGKRHKEYGILVGNKPDLHHKFIQHKTDSTGVVMEMGINQRYSSITGIIFVMFAYLLMLLYFAERECPPK